MIYRDIPQQYFSMFTKLKNFINLKLVKLMFKYQKSALDKLLDNKIKIVARISSCYKKNVTIILQKCRVKSTLTFVQILTFCPAEIFFPEKGNQKLRPI